MSSTGWVPQPQETKSAPNYVIDQIREALFARRLNPGDRLPSESALSEAFGVSRGSVRQAMKALETLGILSIRPGDGTYINNSMERDSFNPLAFALLISRPSVKTLSDARYALERDIFELLLEDDERLREILPRLKQNIEERKEMLAGKAPVCDLVRNDRDFHSILSKGCGNVPLQIAYDYVVDSFRQYMENTASIQPADDNKTVRDHTAIYEALKNRNYSEAKQASRQSMKACFEALPKEFYPPEWEE